VTIPASNDDAAPVLTRESRPAAAVSAVEALWESRGLVVERSGVERILGRSPLRAEAHDLFAKARGEARAAELLRSLSTSGEPWRVLHAIPLVDGATEVDHLVIGPAGVFAVSTATRSGSGATVREPAVEARRASELLSGALGRPVVVRAVVVVVESVGRPITDADPEAGDDSEVDVVGLDRLVRHLRSLVPVQSVDEVREITRAALRPRTWRSPGDSPAAPATKGAGAHAHPTASELGFWLASLSTEVAGARRVRVAWLAAASGALVAAAALSPLVVQQLSS
jgi:hypothetical protein